jgi:Carboxypeptidase regulatory-like domain
MKHFLLTALAFVFLAVPSLAQNSHGSLTGQVTDSTGAIIPKAQVTVTNTDTGAIFQVVTTAEGFYTAPELPPGPYQISVESPGFEKYVRQGIHLETQQNATINIKMSIGTTEQTVNVSSDAPLIDTADASTGQVLTNEEVEDLPSNGRNPLGFARIEYGAVPKAKHAISSATPFGQQTADDFSLGGGNSASNEILLNGVPNFQDSGRNAGFSPSLDAVNEVRVDVFGANAMYGDTSGGTVNVTTKSGTNKFHGSASWFYQAAGCSSLDGAWVSRSVNHCESLFALPWTTIKQGGAVPPATHQNQVGATIGGPIWIPKVFNGRDKLFFFYAYEAVVGQMPPTQTIGTVPTAAERTGDFSALLALGPAYQLYNPNGAVGTQTSYTRSMIPGNIFANAGLTVDPIAAAYYKSVPLPNYNGPTTTADGQNNYFAFTPNLANYRSHSGRIDYNLSAKNKMWGEAHRSRYLTSASNYFHDPLTGTVTDQILSGGLVEDVETFTPTLFLDVRGGVSRYDNTNFVASSGISPTSVGFPGYLASNSTALALPQIQFTDATNPLSFGNQPGSIENFDTIQLFTNLTKIWGPHSFKIGTDIRAYKYSTVTPGAANGTFTFGRSNGNPVAGSNLAAPATFGSSFALFDLGIATSGSYNIVPAFQYNSFLDAFFVQDDWKISSNLTASMGVRFEHETPVVESGNRMANGFNPGAVNEATAGSIAAYASSPSPLLPTASFQPTGGITFSNPTTRNAYNPAPLYFSPRIGLIYAPEALHQKGVVRIGYGIYTNPFNDFDTGQTYGYSATTAYIQTVNGGLNNFTFDDPFPTATNPLQKPTGNALGVNTNLGAKVVYYSPSIKVPYSERASLDVQYQIGKTVLIELGYINNHQVHLSYSNAVDTTPLLPYLSRSPYYDGNATNLLTGATYKGGGPASTDIPNPFKGQPGVTGTYATTPLLAPNIFLMTNPEFTSVTEQLVPGSSSNYNALNARVYKQMGHGLTINGVFEWSRLLGTFGQLNSGDILNYQETSSDYPFHFSGYGTYQLPFGRGRQFANGNRFLNPIIGGFQVSAVYQFISGMAIPWGNVIYTGSGFRDFHNVQHSSLNVTGGKVFNTAVFDTRTNVSASIPAQASPYEPLFNPPVQPNAENYRTFPAYLLRQDYTSNWDADIQKNTTLAEGVVLELRLDAFNLLNRPQYNTPNVSPTSSSFGTTAGVYSGANARQLQLGAHVTF